MGLSHGFQAHFVNNANYSTLIILFTMELLKLLVNDKTSPYNCRIADFVHPGFFIFHHWKALTSLHRT